MNKFLLPVAAMAISFSAVAQDLPKASPQGEVEQVVGLTKVEVEYSRPSVRDRQIFGDLLPYDKVWRLGANYNTTIEVSGPVMINGEKLAKGKYSMFAIPGKDAWEIIFNKNTELWGESDRKEEEDVLRVKAKVEPSEFTETLLISFDEVKDDKARMDIRWEKTRVSLSIAADATEQAMENIKKAMSEPEVKAGTYASSARFAIDRGVMTKEALEWAQKAVKMDPKFYYLHTLALAQAANGQKKEAVATAEKSMTAAKEAGSDAYVKMNEAKIKEWTGK
ncbi:MAG: DUF2911 domain-containing protein [Flavobacteriales bacterium]|nr:DUF2911 domain-containing protein [Flavobacteriales bacterium]